MIDLVKNEARSLIEGVLKIDLIISTEDEFLSIFAMQKGAATIMM